MAHKFDVSLSTVKFWEQNRTEPKPTVRYDVEAFLKSHVETTEESAPTAEGDMKPCWEVAAGSRRS